jgi:glyoxylase-like metal-dependent hydrolase (beta-lactamase superfamily II)
VEVRTQDGPYVVAGDCVYWYQNLESRWPPGYVQGNPWNLLELYGELDELLTGRTQRLVPGHDPELFRRHPSWTSGQNETAELHAAAALGSKLPRSD